jgi:ribosomal protein S18 acetylase RimI-like enzyme
MVQLSKPGTMPKFHSQKVTIRRLVASDALAYWQTRNQGLKEFPDAFTTSYEEGVATPPEKLAKRFGNISDGNDDFVLGAFANDGTLLGYVGFKREDRAKQRHKGKVEGMYVTPAARGTGFGKRLLLALIAEARAMSGLEQIWLTVTASNGGARNLYLHAGFVSFGVEPRAIKVGADYFDKEFMVLRLLVEPK